MNILYIINAVVAVLLIIVISMQNKGTGLSATFGGGGEVITQKRGAEKMLHNVTMWLAIIFCGLSLIFVFFDQPSANTNNALNNTGALINTGIEVITTGTDIIVETSKEK